MRLIMLFKLTLTRLLGFISKLSLVLTERHEIPRLKHTNDIALQDLFQTVLRGAYIPEQSISLMDAKDLIAIT